MNRNILRKSLSEGIGTFAIVFFGCGIIMISERFPGIEVTTIVPIVFGLIVAVMIYAVGHISGAHFNPAVTLAFAIVRHFPKREIFPYCFAQFSGGILAMILLNLLLPKGIIYGDTLPSVDIFQALGWEIILTFFLMFVIISVATDTRAIGIMAGAAIGATVAVCAFVGGPVTGASMNPARSLAPALFSGQVSQLWIYFVGPFIGSILASFCYEWIKCHDGKKNVKGCC